MKKEIPAKKTTAPAAAVAPAAPAAPAASAGKSKLAPKVVGAANVAALLGRPLTKGKTTFGPGAWTPINRVKPEWKKHYEDLLERHDRLRLQINGLQKESQAEMESYGLHMGDSGTDNFDRDLALGMLSSDQEAIFEIEEALRRIEKNTFGICELTGKPIPKTRLDANPWARFTVEAQLQLEREGALRQRNRLGSLGSVETSSAADNDDDDDVEEKPVKSKED